MTEQIEQYMRALKLGGLAKNWRSVQYISTEQYLTELLKIELHEREVNRINRMVKTAGFRVIKTLDDFVWNSSIELPHDLTQEYMTELSFLQAKENTPCHCNSLKSVSGRSPCEIFHCRRACQYSVGEKHKRYSQQLSEHLEKSRADRNRRDRFCTASQRCGGAALSSDIGLLRAKKPDHYFKP